MKKLYLDLITSGFNSMADGIIQIGGIIDVDNTIVDTFNIKCKPFPLDHFETGTMVRYNTSWSNWMYDPEALEPKEVMSKLLTYLDKHVDKNNSVDKLQIVEHSFCKCLRDFLKSFFDKNENSDFEKYFWFPSLDLEHISAFILEKGRHKFPNFDLQVVAYYFGFNVDKEKFKDAYYRVNIVRDLYYILSKFRNQQVLFKRVKIN